MIARSAKGKIQTDLVIFTGEFTDEFHKAAEKFTAPALGQIISYIRKKLGQIREISKNGKGLSDTRLLWGLLWPMMLQGHKQFSGNHPEMQERDQLYDGATGTNYGISGEVTEGEFATHMFAGYSGKTKLFHLLSEEIGVMTALYDQLYSCACQLMRVHAPRSVGRQIDRIVFQTLFFRTVGLIGGCAVRSGELKLPDFEGPIAVCVHENSREEKEKVNQNMIRKD